MITPIVVRKGRTTVIQVALGFDVSSDTFTSEIRTDESPESDLLATWVVTFSTDGTDGELILTLDDSETTEIDRINGVMDLKRVSGGEPLDVFGAVPVTFKEGVTA